MSTRTRRLVAASPRRHLQAQCPFCYSSGSKSSSALAYRKASRAHRRIGTWQVLWGVPALETFPLSRCEGSVKGSISSAGGGSGPLSRPDLPQICPECLPMPGARSAPPRLLRASSVTEYAHDTNGGIDASMPCTAYRWLTYMAYGSGVKG